MQQILWLRSPGAEVLLMGCSLLGVISPASAALNASVVQNEDVASTAATVEQTAQVLDLRSLPLPAEAIVPELRSLGMLNYQVSSDPKTAFQYHQQQLLKLGWTELPGSSVEAAYASGMFSRSGFVVSVSTSTSGQPDNPNASLVSITNFGNVRLTSLPVVPGARSLFASDATAIYTTDQPVAETAAALHALFLKSGWEPWGSTDVSADQKHFTVKCNAIQISAMVNIAPAQGGKTSFMLSSLVLSADIPAPTDARELRYDDSHKVLRFAASGSFQDVALFYQETLGSRGWKGTTEELILTQDQFKRPIAIQVFRNAAKDLITLNLSGKEPETRAEVRHQTQQEAAEEERRSREAAEELVAQREESRKQAAMKKATAPADEPSFDDLARAALNNALGGGSKAAKGSKPQNSSKDKDAVSILLPAQIRNINQTGRNVLQVKAAAGKGKATAEFVLAKLLADGWKTDEEPDLDTTSGNISLIRGPQRISLNYVDTGVTDVNLMIIGIGTNLEATTSKP